MSHQAAGRPQRGQAQPRSRSWTARRMLAGIESEYPMSSGSDGVLYGGASRVVRSQPAMPAGPVQPLVNPSSAPFVWPAFSRAQVF